MTNNPHNHSSFVYNNTAPQTSTGMGTASMVLGIISLITVWWYGLGLILAVIGLILGIIQQGRQKNGMASAGIIMSIITIAIAVLTIIGIIAIMAIVFATV